MKTQLILACSFVAINSLLAQDIETLNPNSNWVQLNPAYAGSNGGFRTQLNSGSSINYGYAGQYGFSSDFYLSKSKSGISVSLNNLRLGRGTLIENAYSIGYSKRIVVKENKIEIVPAIQVTGLLKSLDVNALNFDDVPDPRFGASFNFLSTGLPPQSRKDAIDVNAGALLDLKNGFVLGLSARHINQPDVGMNGFFRLPAKYIMHASYDKVLDENTLLNVMMILWAQNGTEEAKLQASAVFKKHLYVGVGAGASNNYKTGTAAIGYRGNLWSISTVLGTNYYSETQLFRNSAELALSVNIRDKEQRKSLTALHMW